MHTAQESARDATDCRHGSRRSVIMNCMSENKRTTTVDLPESPVILTRRQDRARAEHLLRRVAPEAIEGDGVARLDVSAFTSSL